MADKRVQYTLGFTADTEKAKAQLRDLQNQLTSLITSVNQSSGNGVLSKDIQQASLAAAQLKVQLQEATSVTTGKLDLTKFNQSLIKSNMTIEKYKDALLTLGPSGAQTFSNLATSITQAEVPMIRLSAKVKDLGQTLSNTVKWQISSSAIHAFMGAIQGAYGYAQNLNESLNNIRIVTGQSTDQMAAFAKQANNAAKALSTTTVEYTDAALIYYQQGLKNEEVQERAEVTMKMANVSRESAQIVSDQMTAVWNNFYNGSKSLEYYADVMTALGAATASSTDEIATGLEKFAAISNTVGLSYEYATSALATVTATTRQSADVVGTAFRTMFTRIQGLQQGETAEDGVDLNKYSQALANVGIQILDTNGQIKEMDTILNELGERWKTLGKEQQIALAQTVGGARQYTTLVALMDKWTFFQENLQTSYGATGELNKQQEIYAESWEAARDRVTAALEDIYDSLLKDDFFIDLSNMFADLLKGINNLIDGLGGVKGILLILGSLSTKFFKEQLITGLSNFGNNLLNLTSKGQEQLKALRQDTLNSLKIMYEDPLNTQGFLMGSAYASQAEAQELFLSKSKELTEEQRKIAQLLLDQHTTLVSNVAEQVKIVDQAERQANLALRNAQSGQGKLKQKQLGAYKEKVEQAAALKGLYDSSFGQISNKDEEKVEQANKFINALEMQFEKPEDTFGADGVEAFEKLKIAIEKNDPKEVEKEILGISEAYSKMSEDAEKYANEEGLEISPETLQAWENYGESIGVAAAETAEVTINTSNYREALEKLTQQVNNRTLNSFVELANNLTKIAFGLNSLSNIVNIWKSKDLSFFEKISQSIIPLTTLLPLLNVETLKNTFILAQDTIAYGALSLAQKGVISEGIALNIMFKTFNFTLSQFLGIITVGIGAIWLLIKAFEILKETSPEGQLKKLNEELENAKKAAQQTTSAYNDLKSSIENLESTQNILSGLTKGTKEWKEAVLQLNQQILDLIDKYPELAQYMTSENGILSISEEGLNNVLNSQLKEAELMQQVSLSKQRDIKSLQLENERVVPLVTYTTGEGGAVDIQQKTATESDLVNVFNAALANNAFTSTGEIDFSKLKGEYTTASSSFKSAINNSIDDIEKLAIASEQASIQLESYDKNIANSWLNSQNKEIPEDFKNAYSIGMAGLLENKRDEYSYFKELNSDNAINKYAELTGKSVESIKTAIEEDVYSIDDLINVLIDNAAAEAAYQEIESKMGLLTGYKNDPAFNVVSQIVASGGDKSSWNALTNEQVEQLKNVLKDPENGLGKVLKAVLEPELFELISKAVNVDALDYEKASFANRMILHDEKASQKAKGIISNEELDTKEIENYTKHLIENNKVLEDYEGIAKNIAAINTRMNKGLDSLQENFEDNAKTLKNKNLKNTKEYSDAMEEMKNAVADVVNTEEDMLSDDFILNHMEDIEKAANGDINAIERLRTAAAEDIILELFGKTDFSQIDSGIQELHNKISSFALENDLTITPEMNNADFLQACNDLLSKSNMTVAQATEYFKRLGYDAEFITTTKDGEVKRKTQNVHWFNEDTGKWEDGEGYIETQEPSITATAIKTITYNGSAGGGINFSNTKAGGASTKKSSGSGGGSKKDKKSSSKEIERYHVISNEMEEVQNELDKISTATERAFGADKLALIDAEIQKMKELKDAQDEYVRQIEENFEKDKQAIAAYGAVFDEDGTILNYEEIMQRQIDKFNASRTDAAEEEYQKFLDLLKQYEETNDLLDKERNESIKQAGELLDKKLEDVEHRVNLQVEFNDDTIEYLEFLLEQLEDQAFSAAQSIDLLGRQVQENFDNIKSNSSGLAETLALAGFDSETIDGVLTGDQAAINKMMSQKGIDNNIIESVKEYRDALMGSMSNVRDLQKAIDEELINSLDEASEKFGELYDELNHNADILSSLQNIMDLTGESILGFTDDAKKAIEDAQLDTAVSQVATSYDKLTVAQEEYKKAVESDQSEEVIKAAAEKVREAEEQLLSDWEAALEQATTNFEASIERSVAAFSNAVAGAYGGLDELQDAFDKQEELDDIYIEDYKKIYELTKLSRDISRSIDDSDNIKAKQALRDLQGEINELQKEGVELSEYDIEYLQKKYELRLAEIALEEAQNAKSTVRMTRDSEGNWSYTYTADQDDINEAQQNYEDKLYAIQELSDNYIKDMQSQVLDLLSAYEDEMAKINFSEEGWEQKAKEIEAFYQAKFNLLAQQFEGALGNQSDIYGEWEDYSALTGYGISANQDFIDSFDETTLSQLTGFQTMAEYQQVFTTNSQKLLTDLSGSFMDWRDHVQRVYEQAGKSTEDFAEKVGDMAEGVKEDNQSVVDSSESLKNEVIDSFEEAANGASAFADTWNEKIKTMTDSNNDLVESINDIIEAWARLNNAEEEKNRKQEQNEQEEKNDSSNNNNNNNNNNKTLSENDSVSVKTSATHFATGQQMAGFVPGGSYSVMQVSGDRVLIGRNGVATGWVKKTDLVGFHSGGYTGEWGSSGKLAMLHEKELVLNANDTKNILTSVELMREISQAIDLNASMSAYSNAISAAMPNTGVITNQNIVINAEFPDATDRLEIQAAFDNLLNRASQYANRK